METTNQALAAENSQDDVLEERKKKKLDSVSWWTCITYFLTILGLGLHLSAPGPILKDIEKQVGLDLSAVSYIFSARAIGYIIGSVIGGYIIDKHQKIVNVSTSSLSNHILLRIDPHKIYFGCVVVANISMIIIPFLNNFASIMILFIITGLTYGQVDTYANVFLLALFDTKDENDASVKPFMQFLHFMFGVGAFISPLFIQLSFHYTDHYTLSMLIFGIFNILASFPLLFVPTPTRKNSHDDNLMTSTSSSDIDIDIEMKSLDQHHQQQENEEDIDVDKVDDADIVIELKRHDMNANNKCIHKCNFVYLIMFVFALFFAVCVGAEVAYGGYIATYAINYLGTKKSVGRYMSSIFWLGLSIGRLSAVFTSHKLSTFQMLVINIIGLIVGNLLLIIFSGIVIVSHISAFICGFGMSSMFPCAFLYGEETITVSGKFASTMVFGASVGEFIIPTLLGNMMHIIGDRVFETIMLMTTIVMASTLGIIVCSRKKLNQ